MMSNLGFLSVQQERKCSASRMVVVSSNFLPFAAMLIPTQVIIIQKVIIHTHLPLLQLQFTPAIDSQRSLGYYQMSNIKYLGFAKTSSALPVFGSALDKSLEEFLKGEIPKVIVKLKELELKKQERQRIKSEFGVWFCKKDQHEIYYLALCANNYPERHIYAAISQLQTHLAQLGDYEHQADSVLKLHAKEKVIEIAQKYDNLKSMDKIGEANRLLDGIKEDIADSTLKLMNNTVNLDGLERKASDLKENAFMFEKSAHEVQREMWWRNCKMKIIIGVVVVALICVIVIPIATTVGKK